MQIYNDFSKNATAYCKSFFFFFFLLFRKCLSYLVCKPSFKSINSSYLSRKKDHGGNFTPIPPQRLRSDKVIWTYRAFWTFLNIAFFKLFYTYFYCLYLRETKPFVQKTQLYFIFFWLVLGWHSVLQYYRFCVSGALFIRL